MSAQTHYTEKLIRRIKELEREYSRLESQKESLHLALVEKLDAAQKRILELEIKCCKKETEACLF